MLEVFSTSPCNDKFASCRKCVCVCVWCLYLWAVTGARLNQLLYTDPPAGHHIQKVWASFYWCLLMPAVIDLISTEFCFCFCFVLGFLVLLFFVCFSTKGQRQNFPWPLIIWLPFNSASLPSGLCDYYHSWGSWSVWLLYGWSLSGSSPIHMFFLTIDSSSFHLI